MKHHSKTSPFSRSLRLAVAMVCALMALFYVYVVAEKQIDRANEQRYQSRMLANELRQSSDDLTRMVRTYVVTGNPVYKQHYLDILAIRDGKKPRPLNYEDIYWDLTAAGDQPAQAVGDAPMALLTLMKQAGFTADELAKLAQSKAKSDMLTGIEFNAMALVESTDPDLDARRILASQMLHDGAYHQAKVGIMQPINEFYEMSDQRTQLAVQDDERTATWLRVAFVLLGLGLLASLWRAYRALHTTLGGSLDAVHAQIARLGDGDFSEVIEVAPAQKNSVLGWLTETQQQLRDLAQAQLVSEARLRRLSRLYAALSACNQALSLIHI